MLEVMAGSKAMRAEREASQAPSVSAPTDGRNCALALTSGAPVARNVGQEFHPDGIDQGSTGRRGPGWGFVLVLESTGQREEEGRRTRVRPGLREGLT